MKDNRAYYEGAINAYKKELKKIQDFDGRLFQWEQLLFDYGEMADQNTTLLKENDFLKQENERLRSVLKGENECFCLCSDCAEGNHCQVADATDDGGVIGDCFVKVKDGGE